MKSNPGPRWTPEERLQRIAELAERAINDRSVSIPNLAFRAMNGVRLLASQPSDVLDVMESKVLMPQDMTTKYMSYLSTGIQRMTITTNAPWDLIDASRAKMCDSRVIRVTLLPGRHKFERITNPYGPRAVSDFLVLRGTLHGFAESYWQLLEWNEEEKFRVVIEDDSEQQSP
ncbi:MAG: hypothetical protein AAB365_00905 [Patescibacteria group bacterium]